MLNVLTELAQEVRNVTGTDRWRGSYRGRAPRRSPRPPKSRMSKDLRQFCTYLEFRWPGRAHRLFRGRSRRYSCPELTRIVPDPLGRRVDVPVAEIVRSRRSEKDTVVTVADTAIDPLEIDGGPIASTETAAVPEMTITVRTAGADFERETETVIAAELKRFGGDPDGERSGRFSRSRGKLLVTVPGRVMDRIYGPRVMAGHDDDNRVAGCYGRPGDDEPDAPEKPTEVPP